jgi:hypothetical protein
LTGPTEENNGKPLSEKVRFALNTNNKKLKNSLKHGIAHCVQGTLFLITKKPEDDTVVLKYVAPYSKFLQPERELF